MSKVDEIRTRLIGYMEDRLKTMLEIDELVKRKRLIHLAIAATEEELRWAIEQEPETETAF